MGQIQRAARAVAPRVGADGNTTVRYYTADTSSKANAVPDSWCGRYVSIYASGDPVYYYFSTDSTDTCDEAAAPADGGAGQDDLGGVAPEGAFVQVQIPPKKPAETMYFVRAAADTAAVRMELRDDPEEVTV
jgi:hypothetical protein